MHHKQHVRVFLTKLGILVNRQIILASRPTGLPCPENFRMIESSVPVPGEGEVLIRHTHLGLAPAARLQMGEAASYRAPMKIGDVIYGQALGTVLKSRNPLYREGDVVMIQDGGWQEYSISDGHAVTKVESDIAPLTVWLGALGTSGMTAYVGLLDFGLPQMGETVVVSAASGAVGSMVGQIARIKGCRVVGIAGGQEKMTHLRRDFGYDAAVDYKDAAFDEALREACSAGIDVYFDNVGGHVRDVAWPLMNRNGRIVVCGQISEYNDSPASGPGWFDILARRLSVRGFILSDHANRRPDFLRDMGAWYREGRIAIREEVQEGLDLAVPAFIAMLQGKNSGKAIIKL
ncbi:2-alkenal reductase [Advenella kashmirensis W13003]|uniref:2-alkenal reductase n=1 Tax=Advenella kashmirensis W13003 TaxID=1424334 RepID=V8QWI0_9BURK|nr:2-alkenal reductase [Advenella kashmirensis W13003]